jgi:hypothetical protein
LCVTDGVRGRDAIAAGRRISRLDRRAPHSPAPSISAPSWCGCGRTCRSTRSYARAFGGFGATVERTADFAGAFKAARHSGKPSIIHVKIDPEAITPATTLSKIREQTMAKAV